MKREDVGVTCSWRDFMEHNYPELESAICDMQSWTESWTVWELLEGNDPDAIVEMVGDHASIYFSDEDDDDAWSDMCMMFYDWWGCLDLASSTPEWDKFWLDLLAEEQELIAS
jgi:hypothetical protein